MGVDFTKTGHRTALVAAGSLAAWLLVGPAPAAAQMDVSDEEAREDAERAERHAESMANAEQEARSHFRVGRTLYEEGRFRAAAEEFRQAYELSERPELLFNVYLAYRDAGALEQATEALGSYLEQVEQVESRDSLEARLQAMRETLEEQRAAEERRQREAASQAASETQQRERARAEEEIAEARAQAKRDSERSVVPWILGGTGLAMLAVGTVTGVLTLRDVDALEEDCQERTCPPTVDLSQRREETRRLARTTDGLLFGGAAVLGTGVLLYLLDVGGGTETEAAPEAAAACGPDGCSAEVRVRF